MREWRRRRGEGRRYRQRRKEYKDLCEKKRKDNEKWERKVMEAGRESEVWEVVTIKRRRTKRVNENIKRKNWENYFMRLLERWSLRWK